MQKFFLLFITMFIFMNVFVGFHSFAADPPIVTIIGTTETIELPGVSALPSETPTNSQDVITALIELVKNRQGMKGLALVSAIMMLLFQFMKLPFILGYMEKLGGNWKRVIIISFGQVVGIILAVNGGGGILDSILAGLITSGYAGFIFEFVIKPLFPEKKI
jgi:hypothetical protein